MLGDVDAERGVARPEARPEALHFGGVGPERGARGSAEQMVHVELKPAELEDRSREVEDEPPLQIETGRAMAAAVQHHLLAEVGQRGPRDLVGHAVVAMPSTRVLDGRGVHEDPEATPLQPERGRQ